MNRIKLVACPFCSAPASQSCKPDSRHPITHQERFHRLRVERAVREVGLVAPRSQPAQLQRYQQKSLLP